MHAHRLYLQIYATVLVILVLLGLATALVLAFGAPEDHQALTMLATLADRLVPPSSVAPVESGVALHRLARDLGLSLALFTPSGERVGDIGGELPAPDPDWSESRFVPSRGAGLTVALRLSDDRWLVVRHPRARHAPSSILLLLLFVGAVVAAGSYPIVRRLTGRLERLQRRVEALGAGELGARIAVEGRDEVAELARSFNRAAERIERLVEAQRALLAGASHELRSPLARIRVAVELLGDAERPRPDLKERIVRDIAELDELLDELLLMARVDAADAITTRAEIQLETVCGEEATRYGAALDAEPVRFRGDETLIRRLVRNLLDNASRHAGGREVVLELRKSGHRGAVLRVLDRGPGVVVGERNRVFEPFYRGATRDAANPQLPGVGLGLALVRRIARLHGGDATCRERDGGGAIFEVVLRND